MSFIENLTNEIMEDKPAESRFPLWMHYALRILLQFVAGWLTWHFYVYQNYMTAALFGVISLYLLATLIFGSWLRKLARDMMTRW